MYYIRNVNYIFVFIMVTDCVLCGVGTEVLYAPHGSVRYASYGCERCRIFLNFTVKFIYIYMYILRRSE